MVLLHHAAGIDIETLAHDSTPYKPDVLVTRLISRATKTHNRVHNLTAWNDYQNQGNLVNENTGSNSHDAGNLALKFDSIQ